MRQNTHYMLRRIHDIPYLIPFGQNTADLRPSMRLNETGAFLWNALSEDISPETLLRQFMAFLEADEADRPVVRRDLDAFLSQLLQLGCLEDRPGLLPPEEPHYCDLSIGSLRLRLAGDPAFFSPAFDPFIVNEDTHQLPDMTIRIHGREPVFRQPGEILLRDSQLWVIRTDAGYQLLFPTFNDIYGAVFSSDGQLAEIYCRAGSGAQLQEDLFHVCRFIFLYRAQLSGLYAIHSASLLYAGKAWLFSGHSGMGKSTHTDMWHQLQGVPLINGDLNLITLKDGVPMVYGLPWCGTSGISTPGAWPLGGILLLKQDPEDHVDSLAPEEQTLRLMQRLISPTWTRAQTEDCLAFCETLSPQILTARLRCTKTPAAVDCCRRAIDFYLHAQLPAAGHLK